MNQDKRICIGNKRLAGNPLGIFLKIAIPLKDVTGKMSFQDDRGDLFFRESLYFDIIIINGMQNDVIVSGVLMMFMLIPSRSLQMDLDISGPGSTADLKPGIKKVGAPIAVMFTRMNDDQPVT